MGIFNIKKKCKPEPEQTYAEKVRDIVFRLISLTLGAVIVAFALECFLIPNKIIDGGVIGVSMMLNTITGVNLGTLILFKPTVYIFGLYDYRQDICVSDILFCYDACVVHQSV